MFLFSTQPALKTPLFCARYLERNIAELLESLFCVIQPVFVNILIPDFELKKIKVRDLRRFDGYPIHTFDNIKSCNYLPCLFKYD